MRNLRRFGSAFLFAATAGLSGLAHAALLNTSFGYNVTGDDAVVRASTGLVTRLDNFGADRRPVVVFMPGWDGVGDVGPARDGQTTLFANNGYVVLNIGFHQTNAEFFHSDLPQSAEVALAALCAETYADCTGVVLVGESYGGTQTHIVTRYLRSLNTFDGSGGANASRKVVGFLGQDSGYTLYYFSPPNADATAYSVAMIQNLGDGDFPVDSCDFDNCGARNRGDYHQAAPGSQFVLSYCHPGGSHGARNYADWDNWVLSAVKTMIHNHRGVAKFAGYVEPTIGVSNACVTTPSAPVAPAAPTIGTATAGNASISVTFTPGAIGSGALVNYTADCGGVTQTGSSSPIVVGGLVNGTPYTCRVKTTSTVGTSAFSAASNSATPAALADPNPPRLANISTRGQVRTGNDVMIGGFIIGGSSNKTVAIVAYGPSLVGAGIPNALANPTMTIVRSSDGAVIATNDNWGTDANAAQLSSAGLAPSNALESAVLMNLAPGAYTAVVSGVGGGTGVGLIAMYEVDHPEVPLINISTRGLVLTGNDVMIGGFIVQGSGPQTVAVVAYGPSLAAAGIANPMANPTMTIVRSSDGAIVAVNDNWGTDGNAAALAAAGFAPSNAQESAVLMSLAPGAYTAIVSGVGGATGVAIVAVYRVP
jgi:hypothetical protein